MNVNQFEAVPDLQWLRFAFEERGADGVEEREKEFTT